MVMIYLAKSMLWSYTDSLIASLSFLHWFDCHLIVLNHNSSYFCNCLLDTHAEWYCAVPYFDHIGWDIREEYCNSTCSSFIVWWKDPSNLLCARLLPGSWLGNMTNANTLEQKFLCTIIYLFHLWLQDVASFVSVLISSIAPLLQEILEPQDLI